MRSRGRPCRDVPGRSRRGGSQRTSSRRRPLGWWSGHWTRHSGRSWKWGLGWGVGVGVGVGGWGGGWGWGATRARLERDRADKKGEDRDWLNGRLGDELGHDAGDRRAVAGEGVGQDALATPPVPPAPPGRPCPGGGARARRGQVWSPGPPVVTLVPGATRPRNEVAWASTPVSTTATAEPARHRGRPATAGRSVRSGCRWSSRPGPAVVLNCQMP